MKKIFFLIFNVLYILPATAIMVSGTVEDTQGTLPGVEISVSENTNLHTVTDANGQFTLDVPENYMSSDLVFVGQEYGLATLTLPVQTDMGTVKMSEDKGLTLDASVAISCDTKNMAALNATSAEYSEEASRCIPTACKSPRYELRFADTPQAFCFDLVGETCFDYDDINALTGEYVMNDDKLECVASECMSNGYVVQDGKCVSTENADCTKEAKNNDKNVTSAKIDLNFMDEPVCTIKECKNGWKPSEDGTKCIEMLSECTAEQKSQHPYARKTGIKKGTETCVATDCVCGYDLDKDAGKCVAWKADKKCSKMPKNAKSGKPACRDGIEICEITACDGTEFKHDTENNQCVKTTGDECKSSDKNAKTAKLEKRNNEMVCIIKNCNSGYTPSDDGLKCEQSEGDCSSQVSKIDSNATKGEFKKKECRITECKPGYDVNNNKCVPISGNCKKLPENATRGSISFDEKTQSEICLVSGCKGGFKPSDDKKSCVVDEDEQNKIAELRDNYEKTKANEQSTANKLLGGASMGAMGIGGMMAASAMAEKNVYEDVEMDMASYLATFRCDYGTGDKFKGGEKGIQIPGTAELIPLYSEYVALANDLKARKNALGIKASIESEKILDSATTGLYDDVSTGITSGVYASLSRALMNPDGEDAKKWAAMKEETNKNLKTGLTTAGIGAVVGIAGNAVVNNPKLNANAKERSQEILNKYAKLKSVFQEAEQSQPTATCSSNPDLTGTYPNCTCRDENKNFISFDRGCTACTGNTKFDEDKKECVSVTPVEEKCELTGLADNNSCKCIAGAHNPSGKQCVCNLSAGYIEQNGKCERPDQPLFSTDLAADAFFETGSAKLKDQGKKFLNDFQTQLDTALATANTNNQNILLDLTSIDDFCIRIVGHTDRVPYKNDPTDAKNQKLSEDRANTIKEMLISGKKIPTDAITTSGMGKSQCDATTYPKPNDAKCRRVDVEFWAGSCENLVNTQNLFNSTVKAIAQNK